MPGAGEAARHCCHRLLNGGGLMNLSDLVVVFLQIAGMVFTLDWPRGNVNYDKLFMLIAVDV
jgi:hypothetical protein